jgi:membrane associated rhomboid family serine protease
MRDAAVGFQCPTCVAEGAKSTRSGRTAYGGLRSGNPALTSMVLIAMNAAVWLAIVATGWQNSSLIYRLALVPRGACTSENNPGGVYDLASEQTCAFVQGGDGKWVPGVGEGAYWELLTSAFTHVEIWHIGVNMVALWFLGPQLEMVLGRARFLALYLISALSGSACVMWLADDNHGTLGASAAIFGLLGALLVVAHKVGGDVRTILGWLAINAVITIVGSSFISWQGHLGGFVGGFLVAVVLVYAPRQRRTAIQVAGASLIGVLLVAAIVARAAALA